MSHDCVKVWLHGKGCECRQCEVSKNISGPTGKYMVFDHAGEDFADFWFPDGMGNSTCVEDQHGRRYEIKRIL